jgi:type IX secretion system PorP/SprF family membrane protein
MRITLLLLFGFVTSIYGQKERLVYQYMLQKPLLNYASATASNDLNIAIGYQKQWLGLKGAPQVGQFLLSLPITKASSLGVIYEGQTIGAHTRNTFKLGYAYGVRINRKCKLSFSITGRMEQQSTSYLDLYKLNPGDVVGNSSYNVWNPNFEFGTFFNTKTFYLGLSASNLLNNSFDFSQKKSALAFNPKEIYTRFQIGHDLKLNNSMNLLSSALVHASRAVPVNFDLNVALEFKKKLGIGVSVRSVKDIVPVLFYTYNNFTLSYSYAYTFSEIRSTNTGSHEVFLKFNRKAKKVYYTIVCPRF